MNNWLLILVAETFVPVLSINWSSSKCSEISILYEYDVQILFSEISLSAFVCSFDWTVVAKSADWENFFQCSSLNCHLSFF